MPKFVEDCRDNFDRFLTFLCSNSFSELLRIHLCPLDINELELLELSVFLLKSCSQAFVKRIQKTSGIPCGNFYNYHYKRHSKRTLMLTEHCDLNKLYS